MNNYKNILKIYEEKVKSKYTVFIIFYIIVNNFKK